MSEDMFYADKIKQSGWSKDVIRGLITSEAVQPDVFYNTSEPTQFSIKAPLLVGSLVFVDVTEQQLTYACKVISMNGDVSVLEAIWGMKTESPMLKMAKDETLLNFETWMAKQQDKTEPVKDI
jgi:hypothetical protein